MVKICTDSLRRISSFKEAEEITQIRGHLALRFSAASGVIFGTALAVSSATSVIFSAALAISGTMSVVFGAAPAIFFGTALAVSGTTSVVFGAASASFSGMPLSFPVSLLNFGGWDTGIGPNF